MHLTEKEKAFIREYLKDSNATQAAIRAGYSEKTAAAAASRLMKKPEIRDALEVKTRRIAERAEIDAAYVLRQAVKLHERCMQDIEPVTDKEGNQEHDEEGRPVFAFNANAAARSLEIIGKHIAVQAFKEKVDHNHSGAVNVMGVIRIGGKAMEFDIGSPVENDGEDEGDDD